MSLPDIDFERIRPYDGSRNTGFEELCSQLASLEPAPKGCNFYRKGRGADAGVECYLEKPDGSEIGWQAKYLFSWDNNLVSQLNDSIRTALEKHPRLNEYVVCLPFDLSDARAGKGKAAREKWSDWREQWETRARTEKRTLSITLWGRSEIVKRLTTGDSLSGGRVLYWFGTEIFTTQWFAEQFAKAKTALGARYIPETNVTLPIRQEFLAFARDPDLQKEIDGWFVHVSEAGQSAVEAIKRAVSSAVEPHSEVLYTAIRDLVDSLGTEPTAPDQLYPLDNWRSGTAKCMDLAREAMHWAYDLPPANGKSPGGTDSSRLAQIRTQELTDVLSEIDDALLSRRWALANAKAVLLTGPAGIGKSHLLGDIVEHQVNNGHPAILILGSSFRDDEPWRQILGQLDRPPAEQIKHFLGALDAAAQVAGTRALICVDALNERNGMDIWPNHLAAFLTTADPFPRLGIILSCRTTYVPYVIPEKLGEGHLTHIQHRGFAEDGAKAAKVYLEKRGIVRPGAPNLLPEFENPLFLKTCCDFLDKEEKKELPRGLRGVTSIFEFYNAAITRSLNHRLRLDPHFEIIPRAIFGFAQLLASTKEAYVEKSKAIEFFESIKPSNGNLETSLLSQLESEGLLAIEPVQARDGLIVEMVRFTFERLSDYTIARQLLTDYLDKDNVIASFAAGKQLNDFVFGSKNHKRAGIIEAIAVLLPEQTGVEILDVNQTPNWPVRQAFASSLLWREQIHFKDRTFQLAREQLSGDDLNDLMIAISTEPSNKFNALYAHNILKKKTMPERDAWWSVYLARRGYDGDIETLISWATNNGMEHIENDRAHLAGVMLTWFLTTSHRPLRDKATKGLACILGGRLNIAQQLLREFASINDPYLSERLLGACYGAVLQGNTEGLAEFSQAVFEIIFAGGEPPIDALLRDHAQGIIEYANWRGALPASINIGLVRPPYKSPWPVEYVPDELIETYTVVHSKGRFHDAIVSSTVDDGDFARYQMDHKIDNWSPALLGTWPLPRPEDIYEAWWKDFSGWASRDQLTAYRELLDAANRAKGEARYAKTAETEDREAAKRKFKSLLSSDQWEDFRASAEIFTLYVIHDTWRDSRAASFDSGWARRWVCKRAHDLGWTADRFEEFETSCRSHGRHDHDIERIGKKYQWIALRELLARMSDNLAYIGDAWLEREKPATYRGARQTNLRDIDPSLLITESHYDGWAQWGKTWWVPVNPVLRPVSPEERLVWLESENDIVNDAHLIDVLSPKTGRRWLALWSFASWRSWGLHADRKELQRDTWFRLQCIVVRREDEVALVEGLSNRSLADPHSLPKVELHSDFYLGEYPWHPDLENADQWSPGSDWRALPVPTRPTVASYLCEHGGYDHSINRTIKIEIPAPWLAGAMGLHMISGRSPAYVDESGREMFYDPSVLEPGPAAALVDREAFLRMLERENLSAVWVIAGEKSAYGSDDPARGFGGRLIHTAIYQLRAGSFSRRFHREWERPSKEQLARLRGKENSRSGVKASVKAAKSQTSRRKKS